MTDGKPVMDTKKECVVCKEENKNLFGFCTPCVGVNKVWKHEKCCPNPFHRKDTIALLNQVQVTTMNSMRTALHNDDSMEKLKSGEQIGVEAIVNGKLLGTEKNIEVTVMIELTDEKVPE